MIRRHTHTSTLGGPFAVLMAVLLAVCLSACGLLEIKIRKVTFQTNGVKPIPQQTLQYGKRAKKPVDPTKESYLFQGWFSNPQLSTPYDFDSPVHDNLTLYAKWELMARFPRIATLNVLFKGENAEGIIDEYGKVPTISITLKTKQDFGTDSIITSITRIETTPKQLPTNKEVGDPIYSQKTAKNTITVTAHNGIHARTYNIVLRHGFNPVNAVAYNQTDTLGLAIKDSIMAPNDIVLTAKRVRPITPFDFSFVNVRGRIRSDEYGTVRFTRQQLEKTSAVTGQHLYLIYGDDSIKLASYHPHDIRDWRDLQAMRQDLKGSYRLMRDLALPSPGQQGMRKNGFFPIGYTDAGFTGNFDGQHHTISNLVIKAKNELFHVGLFARVSGRSGGDPSILKNLHIRHGDIEGGITGGALAGILLNTLVYRVSVAPMEPGSTIRAFPNELPRRGAGQSGAAAAYVGGLVGFAAGSAEIYAHSTSAVACILNPSPIVHRQINAAGGLVGNAFGARVFGYATGNVTFVHDQENSRAITMACGGLVGMMKAGGTVTGYATGNVNIRDNRAVVSAIYPNGVAAGGLVGLLFNGQTYAVKGYATGNVAFDFVSIPLTGNNGLPISDNGVGGWIGVREENTNMAGTSGGYARGNIIWEGTVSTNNVKIGKLGRQGNLSCASCALEGYTSGKAGESGLPDNYPGTNSHINSTPIKAYPITITSSTTQRDFNLLVFGSAPGQWAFTPGKWPAIVLPARVGGNYQPQDQPTGP